MAEESPRSPARYTGAAVRVTGVIGEKILHVDDASHGIRADAFLDVAIVHFKGDGFAEIGAAVYLIDHGIMGMDILPQAFLGFAVEVDHIAAGLILDVVVDRNIGIVLVPAPVFLPGQTVAEQTAMGDGRKVRVQLMELGVIPADTRT